MDIEFCPKCKSMMMPSDGKLKCRKCGHVGEKAGNLKVETHKEIKQIIVLEEDRPNLPTIEQECTKCGNNACYFWLIQTRASDEPPTRFFRCTKCNNTWREYS